MADSSRMVWLLAIEYLAKFQQLDPSILHDLIDEAPELSEDLGNGTREMVALRCLEQLFATSKEVVEDVPSVKEPKDAFDFSKSCEDVLQSVLKERAVSDLKMSGGNLLKWDIRPFIMHKRASVPKCALEQLKDTILEGTHLYTASLIELSGLVHKNAGNDRVTVDYGCRDVLTRGIGSNRSDSQTMSPEGGTIFLSLENMNGMVEGDSYHRNFLLFKRKKSDMDNEHPAGDYPDEQDGDRNLNVKRFKQDTFCANECMEHVLNVQCGNELVEDSSEVMLRVMENGSCHVEGESQVGGLGKCRYSENDHIKFVAIERPGRSPNANADGQFQRYQCENDHNANNMLPDTSGDRPRQYTLVDEVNKAEPSTSNDAPSARTQQRVFAVDTNANSDRNKVKSANADSSTGISRRISVEKAGCGMEHLYEEDTSIDGDGYHHERVDVAMEKSNFLSSQCTLSHVSQESWTELNLCVKCSEGGQLLVCNAVGCPLVVHEKCLGSSPRFDEKGDFSCPFCAYSLAISEYLQAKKKASLARKELGAFICRRTKRLHNNQQNNCEQNEDGCHLHMVHERGSLADKESDQTNNEGHANEVNDQLKKRQGGRQPMEPIISCPDVNLSHKEKEPNVIPGEKEKKELAPECQHVRETDGQDQISADPKSNVDNQISINKVVLVSLNEKQSEGGIRRTVLEQQNSDLIEKPVGAIDIDRETSVEGNEENIISNYSRKFRGRGREYVSPALPQTLRRKKVPWTAKEEEMLKEGVQKFATVGDRTIPWKKILGYGSMVLSHRTTVDLKDKWRNMCKGSSRCQ